MKKKITLALAALGLLTGGILTRSWAISWPQSAFREWQTAFNPVGPRLRPLAGPHGGPPDVAVPNRAPSGGRAWPPVELDFGVQGPPNRLVIVGAGAPCAPKSVSTGDHARPRDDAR